VQVLRREEVVVAVREEMEAAWPERREIGEMEGAERDHRIMAPSDPPVKREEVEGSTATAVIWCEGGVDAHKAATEGHFMFSFNCGVGEFGEEWGRARGQNCPVRLLRRIDQDPAV
jgi:hypothetical protein